MIVEISTFWKLMFALVLQLVGLLFAALTDSYLRRKQKTVLIGIALMAFFLILQNVADSRLETRPDLTLMRTVNSILGYAVRPVIVVLFLKLVDTEKDRRVVWIIAGINAAVYMTAFFSGVAFQITTDNRFFRGPLGYTCHLVSAVLLVLLVAESYGKVRKVRKLECLIPVFNAILILAATILDSLAVQDGELSCLTVAVVSSCVFYYIWLHLQYTREHEQALVSEQRIQIMISQIQPHFLFNTLSTIQALCRMDPEKAFDTTEKFGNYLRQNIDSLSQTNLIPFEKELEHTKIYTDIEMLRFPSVRIEYDIEDAEFYVPALTVQPLVENAIRHGVRIRPHGVIVVSTRREAAQHVIAIRDNGKGFDVSQVPNMEGSHIGIRNVRERIESLCGGTLEIESEIGKGTTAVIRIPVGKETE